MMDSLDEVAEHRLGDFEVCDDAVFHGPDGHDISRGASEHPFGFFAHGQDVGGARLDGDHGRLPQDDPAISHINEGIGRAEVYSNVVGKQAFELR